MEGVKRKAAIKEGILSDVLIMGRTIN